jgi:hypothetical protein
VNTVVAAASSAGAYAYIRTYIMLRYTYTVYVHYVCVSVQNAFVRTTKSALWLHNARCNIAQNILHIQSNSVITSWEGLSISCRYKRVSL